MPLTDAPTISFSPASVAVAEGDSGNRTLTFTVLRTGDPTGAIIFAGTFAAGTTDAADFGGALPASTFSGIIADGATSATVTIAVSGDTTAELDESFSLTLTTANSASGAVTIGVATAIGTITNDDGVVLTADSSAPITLANDDRLTVVAGVTLAGGTPVTWIGGSASPGAMVDNSGTITGTSRAVAALGATSGSFTIQNRGTISSTGTGGAGPAIDLNGANSTSIVINNAAGGVISTADADAIRPGANATINNAGTIRSRDGSAASVGNDGIDFRSGGTGGVVNNLIGGIIDGARNGITGGQPISVTNRGTILGQFGSGINMNTAGTTTTTVTNYGTITGTAINGADADAIHVRGLASIDNFNTIQALGTTDAVNGTNEAIAIGGGFIHNEARALIYSEQRAITVDDGSGGSASGAVTILNDGSIQTKTRDAISIAGAFADTITNTKTGNILGKIAMGDGNDALNNYGFIAGDVSMGGGDDSITLAKDSSVYGTIDGGDGFDTIYLPVGYALGNITITAVNVERLVIQSGGVMSFQNSGYSEVDVAQGVTLLVHDTIDGAQITGKVELDAHAFQNTIAKATNTTVGKGGDFYVGYLGSASGTVIAGGHQLVHGGVSNTTIRDGGVQDVQTYATNTLIESGAIQQVYANATVTETSVKDGGFQIAWGGTVSATTINGGAQYVYKAASMTVINAGLQAVEKGGIATGTTIHAGRQEIYGGGTATGTTMDGGSQLVYGAANQTTLGSGVIQYLHGMATTTIVNDGGQQAVYADGTATGTTINAGGYQIDWGAATGTTINGGAQYVYGTATGTTIAAGIQHVQSGGRAIDTTIGTGQIAYVHGGGSIKGVTFAGPYSILALDQSSALTGTISGWQTNDYIDLGDILFADGVTSLAYTQNGDHSGGTLTLSDTIHTVALNLLGQYSAADFTLSSDGHGGTLISDPAVAQQAQLAPALHA